MKSKLTMLVLVLVLAAVATAGVWQIVGISPPHASAEAPNCAAATDVLPTFEATRPAAALPALTFLKDGESRRSIADYRGKGVVLNFWATWCKPCVREMPALDRLKGAVRNDGITVLALSADRDGAPVVEKFYRLNRIRNLDTLIDEGRTVLRAMSVRGLPTTVLIDAEGNEIGRVVGAAEWDAPGIVAFLRACLAGTRGEASAPGAAGEPPGKG